MYVVPITLIFKNDLASVLRTNIYSLIQSMTA